MWTKAKAKEMTKESWSLSVLLVMTVPGHAAPRFRADLQKASPVFCGESSEPLNKAGIFDAQIELAFAKDVKDFPAFASEFAATNRHRGFSYGTCRDLRQWLVSTPSPEPVLNLDRPAQVLTLHSRALPSDCESYDIDALVTKHPQPHRILSRKKPRPEDEVLSLKAQSYASLSLTCHPPAKMTQGPELWAFMPLKPSDIIPALASEKELLEWIGRQRREGGLGVLAPDGEDLQKVVDAAALQQNLHHPRALLLKEKATLKDKGVHILGENRAVASSFKEIAELLWNSPQHRRLLLNPSANVIALNTSQLQDRGEKLLVMILAKQ